MSIGPRTSRFDYLGVLAPSTFCRAPVSFQSPCETDALLTVNGWAHTSLFLSACADDAIAAYLIRVRTPRPGTVCDQDLVPFVDFGVTAQGAARIGASAAQDAKIVARAELIPDWLER